VIELFNPYGYSINRVEYLSADANQSMSLTRSPDVTGDFADLHANVSGSFELASPGRDIDGAGFAGNGAFAGHAILDYFVDLTTYQSSGWLWSPTFDWISFGTESYPWVYTYPSLEWWYCLDNSNGGADMYYYSATSKSWHFTTIDVYPWVFDFGGAGWIQK
jgi:hypothetical protein